MPLEKPRWSCRCWLCVELCRQRRCKTKSHISFSNRKEKQETFVNKLCLNFKVTTWVLLPWRLKKKRNIKGNEPFKPPTVCLFPNLLSCDPTGWLCYPLKGPDLKVRNHWSSVVLISTSCRTDWVRFTWRELQTHSTACSSTQTELKLNEAAGLDALLLLLSDSLRRRSQRVSYKKKKKKEIFKRMFNMSSSEPQKTSKALLIRRLKVWSDVCIVW